MTTKPKSTLDHAYSRGYSGLGDNPYLSSSDCWAAFIAGRADRTNGTPHRGAAFRAGRGHTYHFGNARHCFQIDREGRVGWQGNLLAAVERASVEAASRGSLL